jgi:outer membrane receptor protein involved in Fe transport
MEFGVLGEIESIDEVEVLKGNASSWIGSGKK